MIEIQFFGGTYDHSALKVWTDPPIQIRVGTEVYVLVGYDEYTWRYELTSELYEKQLASAQKAETSND